MRKTLSPALSIGPTLALKTSWGQSEADIVGYMDLDLATDLPHFLEAYRALAEEGADLVYGTRLHPSSKVIGRSLKREIASRGFNWLLQTYLGTRFSDGSAAKPCLNWTTCVLGINK